MDELSPRISLPPGTILGGTFQIIRLIGQGGMGMVYMAYDMSLDLKVAIKVISPEFLKTMDESQNEVTFKRFQAEARIVAQIDHPNVIRIFGFKQDTIVHEGQNVTIDYLVMELLAERTLRSTMDESGFETEEEIIVWIAKYMLSILDGLEKVHSCGIIHRDIKPENFFMKEDVVKIADFGLSMGLDLPSVTGSMMDIFGTLTYMAPEQFYNFSLAREPADIFSIGRILYEAVEGKITEKILPFKQVHLTNTNSAYLSSLNDIIMAATAENPTERIGSVGELKDRLEKIQQCPVHNYQASRTERKSFKSRTMWQLLVVFILVGGASTMYFPLKSMFLSVSPGPQSSEVEPTNINEIIFGTRPKGQKRTLRTKDSSILHLIPPMEVTAENSPGTGYVSVDAFYLSESPITNMQYVAFLNTNIAKIKIIDSDVLLDGHLVLKLSEKIRGYKPIILEETGFKIRYPMHSSCAVLMVTGFGAEAYARFFGLRLITAEEWHAVMLSGKNSEIQPLSLPTPIINYPKNQFDIRGINQIAEWGMGEGGVFMVLGQSSSSMIAGALILETNPTKYFTDTSFRVAKNAEPE